MQVHVADELFQCLAPPCVCCLSTSTYSALHLRLIHFAKNTKSPAILPDFLMIFVLYACHILFDLRFIFLSHSVILR